MFGKRLKPNFHPSSPVQPDRSLVPYAAGAIVAALAIWTIEQNSVQDSNRGTTTSSSRQPPSSSARQRVSGNVRTLFSADDYPADAQRNNEQGTVRVELKIDTRGKVSTCAIVRSSGYRSLDTATCRIMQRRARFTPARDVNGKLVQGTYLSPPVTWRLEG